jgi:DNA-binding response OmpR family regulator
VLIFLINILLVDDYKDILKLIQKYFEKKGVHVNAFSNPLLALQDFMKKNNGNNTYYNLVLVI